MAKFLYNSTGSTKYYLGVPIATGLYFQIPKDREYYYAISDDVGNDIYSGDLVVSKDNSISGHITSPGLAIAYLFGESRRDNSGYDMVGIQKPSGLSDGSKASFDYCDKTSWYSEATEHIGITLTNVAATKKYKHNDHAYWIDLTHGKVYQEDELENQMIPVVYDNEIVVNDSNYTIDYTSGEVEFAAQYSVTGPVTADFFKAGSSRFILSPEPNTSLLLEHAELNYSKDIGITKPIRFEVWAYDPDNIPNKKRYKRVTYKNIKDIHIGSNKGFSVPGMDILNQDTVFSPFDYLSMIKLDSSTGSEIRVQVDDDSEFTGEWATATFYFLSES